MPTYRPEELDLLEPLDFPPTRGYPSQSRVPMPPVSRPPVTTPTPSIEDRITETAKQYGVDPALAIAVAKRESALNPRVVGDKNVPSGSAIGLFQLRPGAAQDVGVDPTDVDQNILGGVKYLKILLSKYEGDTAKALMAYNGGQGNVDRGTVSDQAKTYAAEVLSALPPPAPQVAAAAPPAAAPMSALAVPSPVTPPPEPVPSAPPVAPPVAPSPVTPSAPVEAPRSLASLVQPQPPQAAESEEQVYRPDELDQLTSAEAAPAPPPSVSPQAVAPPRAAPPQVSSEEQIYRPDELDQFAEAEPPLAQSRPRRVGQPTPAPPYEDPYQPSLAEHLTNIPRAGAAGLVGGVSNLLLGALKLGSDAMGLDSVSQFATDANDQMEALTSGIRGEQRGLHWIERAALGGVESIGANAPGLLTGTEEVALGLMGLQTFGQAYQKGRKQGLSGWKALEFGVEQGFVEVATEKMPLHMLFGDLAKNVGLWKAILHQLPAEIAGEETATLLQDASEWAHLPENKDKTFKDFKDARLGAAMETAISTLVSTVGQTTAVHAVDRLMGQRERREGQQFSEEEARLAEGMTADYTAREGRDTRRQAEAEAGGREYAERYQAHERATTAEEQRQRDYEGYLGGFGGRQLTGPQAPPPAQAPSGEPPPPPPPATGALPGAPPVAGAPPDAAAGEPPTAAPPAEELSDEEKALMGLFGEEEPPVETPTGPTAAPPITERIETGADLAPPPPLGKVKPLAEGATPTPGEYYTMSPHDITVNAPLMQFKQGVDVAGVRPDTRIEGPWNEDFAGALTLWHDPDTGENLVVNGHNRLDAAKRLGVERVAVRFIKSAQTASEARVVGAMANIVEGNGSPLDVAKLFREANITAEQLEKIGVARRSNLARQGLGLSRLHEPTFLKVVNGELPEDLGAAIGSVNLTPEAQGAVANFVTKQLERGRTFTPAQVRQAALEAQQTPQVKPEGGGQMGLFGEEPEQNVYAEKLALREWAGKQLQSAKFLFTYLSKEARAAVAVAGGNVIDVAKNKEASEKAARVAQTFDTLSTAAGPISDALNQAATEIVQGGNARDIRTRLLDAIHTAVKQELAPAKPPGTGKAGGAAAGGATDGGRGGASADTRLGAWINGAQKILQEPPGKARLKKLADHFTSLTADDVHQMAKDALEQLRDYVASITKQIQAPKKSAAETQLARINKLIADTIERGGGPPVSTAAPGEQAFPEQPYSVEAMKSAFNMTDAQAVAVDAMVRAMGIDTSRVTVVKGGEGGGAQLQGVKGQVDFAEDGRAIIRAFASADVSTALHELVHVARRQLLNREVTAENRRGITDEDIAFVEQWAGAVDGEWTVEAEEKFARAFERYLRDGKAPVAGLEKVFAAIRDWMVEIYQTLTGSDIDIEISPEMRAIFDKLVTRNLTEKPKLEFGKGPPVTVKADQDQPVLPGEAGAVRGEERPTTPLAPEPPLILTGEAGAPGPTTGSLFDDADQEAKINAALEKLQGGLLQRAPKRLLQEEKPAAAPPATQVQTVRAIVAFVGAMKAAGITDPQRAWTIFHTKAGDMAGDVRRVFAGAWAQNFGGTAPTLTGGPAPSPNTAERERRLREFIEKGQQAKPPALPTPPAAPPQAPPVTPPVVEPEGKYPTPPDTILGGLDRVTFGLSPVGFGRHLRTLVKDLATVDPAYAIKLSESPRSLRAQQVVDYLQHDPAFLKAIGTGAKATITAEDRTILKAHELDAETEGTNVHIKERSTDAAKSKAGLLRDFGAAIRRADLSWVMAGRRFRGFIEALKGLPGHVVGPRRPLAGYLSDPELRKLREDAERRADRSGFAGGVREYLSDRVRSLLDAGGVKANIPEAVRQEQIEDVASINRAYKRNQKAFILASAPGAGKTFVLGGAIEMMRESGAKTFLYTTANRKLINQVKEDLVENGYDIDGVEFMTYTAMREAPAREFDVVLFDEAHNIKNVTLASSSQQARAGGRWMEKADFTVFATATPYENPTQLQYLAPTGLFDEVFGGFGMFAKAFGAREIVINAQKKLFHYQWVRTTTSDEDQIAARDWLQREGLYTSRKIQLPPGHVTSRMVAIPADKDVARTFDAIQQAKEGEKIGFQGRAWLTNFQKRLLEQAKIGKALEEAESAIRRGRYPVLFIETKAERVVDIPDLIEKERQYVLDFQAAKRMGEPPPRRKDYGLPPAGVVTVLAKSMQATGQEIIHIKPADEVVKEKFGAHNVALFIGKPVSEKQANSNLEAWRAGLKRVLVVTMAKGGTGLSLHDKKGDHPTTQINVNIPWTATVFTQVAGRTARYGLKIGKAGPAEIIWLFANNISLDRDLGRKVGGRMADMGALIQGEVPEGARDLGDWNLEEKTFADEEDLEETAEMDEPDEQTEEGGPVESRTPPSRSRGRTTTAEIPVTEEGFEGYSRARDIEEQYEAEENALAEALSEEAASRGPAGAAREAKTFYDYPPGEGPAAGGRTEPTKPLDLTELLRIMREAGILPMIVKRFRKAGTLGQFFPIGRGVIKIHAGLGKQARRRELGQVVAHEFGHWLDYVPDLTLERGNLLGRLYALKDYMSGVFLNQSGTAIRNSEIREQLTLLSYYWRPWDMSTNDQKFKEYRNSGVELYADAISAIITDPKTAAHLAPTFFTEFQNELDRKPEFRDAYLEAQQMMLRSPEERSLLRMDRDVAQVKAGEKRGVEIQKEKIDKQRLTFDQRWTALVQQLFETNQPLYKRYSKALKAGVSFPEVANPFYLLRERTFLGAKIKVWLQTWLKPMRERFDDTGVDYDEFGQMMAYRRIAAGEDRDNVINPDFMDKAEAQRRLDAMEKKVGPEKWQEMQQASEKFHDAVADIVSQGHAVGLYTDDMAKEMEKNAPYYVTFRNLKYMHKEVMARVHHQTGAVHDLSNSATATTLKMMATIREIEHQKVKLANFKLLDERHPEDIFHAGPVQHQKKKPDGKEFFEPVYYWKNGAHHVAYVDPMIAASLNNDTIGRNWQIVHALEFINNKLRPLYTTFNVGFQSVNIPRDFLRTWKNTPKLSLGQMLKDYFGKAHTIARVRTWGLPENATAEQKEAAEIVRQAHEHAVMGISLNELGWSTASRGRSIFGETEIEDILLREHVIPPPPERLRVKRWLQRVREVSDYIETLPKAAAILHFTRMENRQVRDLTAQERDHIRNNVGTPDYRSGGLLKPITNNLFLFSHIIMRGLVSDMGLAFGGDAKTRSGFWWKTAAVNVLPKMIAMAGTYGMLSYIFGDDWYEQALAGISEYDKTNYTVVPIGINDKGETVYFRLPQDDTGRMIGGLAWKMMGLARDDQDLRDSLFQLVDYMGGQAPSLSPPVGALYDAGNIMTGRSPYDSFRQRDVLTEEDVSAHDLQTYEKLLAYEFTKIGGNVLLPFGAPGLGRWLRVSDFGKTESLRNIQRGVRTEEDRMRRIEREKIEEQLPAYRALPPFEKTRGRVLGMARDIVKEVYPDLTREEQNKKTMTLSTKIRRAAVKGQVDRLLDVVMSAESNNQKKALIERSRATMGEAEYSAWLAMAEREGVISKPLHKELLQPR